MAKSIRNCFLTVAAAATAALGGCAQPPAAQKTQITTAAPAPTKVSTAFATAIFSEIATSANTTCFALTSHYSSSQGHGDIECVEGATQDIRAGQTAAVAYNGRIGENTDLYQIKPATRPDVTCFAATSTFTGSQGGGHISCKANIKM